MKLILAVQYSGRYFYHAICAHVTLLVLGDVCRSLTDVIYVVESYQRALNGESHGLKGLQTNKYRALYVYFPAALQAIQVLPFKC